jgi:dihydrofolate reductase
VVEAHRRRRSGGAILQRRTKYVVSATLANPTWRNSEVIGRYDPDAIRGPNDEVDGDIYTSGSGTLVRAMLAI